MTAASTSAAALSSADYHAILAELPTLYQAGDLSTFPRRIMLVLSRLISADSWAYEECNPLCGRVLGKTYPDVRQLGITPESLARFASLLPTHPVFHHWLTQRQVVHPAKGKDGPSMEADETSEPAGTSGALAISDFVSRAYLDRVPIYSEYYRGRGVEDQLALLIDFPKPMMVAVGINRSSRSFTDRDRLILNLLHPHFLTAYRNAEAMSQMAAAPGAGRSGTLRVSATGRIAGATGHAQTLLAQHFGPAFRARHLPLMLRRWLDRIRANAATPRGWTGQSALGTLVLRVLSAAEDDCLHVIVEEHPAPPHSADIHPALAALPPRLRQTLHGLQAGKSVKQIATDLGISRHTAGEHVARLYTRFNVRSRGELLALFLKARRAATEMNSQSPR